MNVSKEETEVTVIGGGIFGLSTAYFLAKRGVDVILLEKDRIAGGASGSNAAVIEKGHLAEASKISENLIQRESYKIYHDWNKTGEIKYDIELNDLPSLICFTEEHIESMKTGFWKT